MLITVQRTRKTKDGIFGQLSIDSDPFTCYTCENLAKSIKAGKYKVKIDLSPRFKYLTPHIVVPERDEAAGGDAGIRIHSANYPRELEGCIAPGINVEPGAVRESRKAFALLMEILKPAKELEIEVKEDYQC